MNMIERPLTRMARRYHMDGHKAILFYIAGIVTASLVISIYQAVKEAM